MIMFANVDFILKMAETCHQWSLLEHRSVHTMVWVSKFSTLDCDSI